MMDAVIETASCLVPGVGRSGPVRHDPAAGGKDTSEETSPCGPSTNESASRLDVAWRHWSAPLLSGEGWRRFRVARKAREAEGICPLFLVAQNGRPLPPFLPGQHITLALSILGQKSPAARYCTLSEAPRKSQTCYRITVKRLRPFALAPEIPFGVASNFLHDCLEEGMSGGRRVVSFLTSTRIGRSSWWAPASALPPSSAC